MTKDNQDYAVYCNDCGALYAPLAEESAALYAAQHCERQEHTNAHATTLESLFPLVGKFTRVDEL